MADNRAVQLTESQQALIGRLVDSGRYNSRDDVISAGLQLLEQREKQGDDLIAVLEKDILLGLQSGPTEIIESSEELLTLFRQHRR